MGNDRISCTFSIVDLEDSPTLDYEALSYVWGDEKDTESILLRDAEFTNPNFPILPNLATALRHLRFKDKVRVLWIDAICINQNDKEEKNQQVALMGNICSCTAGLLIWLGSGDDNSNRAMDFVLEFACQLEPETDEGSVARNQALLTGYIASLADDLAPFLAFRYFCDNKWFTRGWIVQEVLLPLTEETLEDGRKSLILTRRTLICGRKEVSWTLFSRLKNAVGVHSWSDKHLDKFPDRIPCGKEGNFLTRIPLTVIEPKLSPPAYQKKPAALRDLVYEYRDKAVTNARDKIYAFLGLATDLEEEEFKPKYELEVPEAYADFDKFLLTRSQPGDKPLRLLSAGTFSQGTDR